MRFEGMVKLGFLTPDDRLGGVREIGSVIGRVNDAGRVLRYRFEVEEALQREFTDILDDGEADVPELPAYYSCSSSQVSFCSALYLNDQDEPINFPEDGEKLSRSDALTIELAVRSAQLFYEHILRDEPVACWHDSLLAADISVGDERSLLRVATNGYSTEATIVDETATVVNISARAEDNADEELTFYLPLNKSNLLKRPGNIPGIYNKSGVEVPFFIDSRGSVVASRSTNARVGLYCNLSSVIILRGRKFTTWRKKFTKTRKWLITDVQTYVPAQNP